MPLMVAVMGTTASGKTELSEGLADKLGARLINADAFQVYRHLDIGTAKSSRKNEYEMVDILDPDEPFGVGEWVSRVRTVLEKLNGPAVVVGGTGLYIRALTEGYSEMGSAPDPALRQSLDQAPLEELVARLEVADPGAHAKIDLKNRVRVQRAMERVLAPSRPKGFEPIGHRILKLCTYSDPELISRRISARTRQMFADGWPEEVAHIKALGYERSAPAMRAHGYRHIWDVNEGTMRVADALDETTREVQRYAKRQRTWLRKEPSLIRLEPDEPLNGALRRVLELE